jgi:hypothetical protein
MMAARRNWRWTPRFISGRPIGEPDDGQGIALAPQAAHRGKGNSV